MNISTNWLSQYVDHDLSPEALADELTMAGLEVDGIETSGQPLDGVVVGEVEAVRNHPNADRLVLCDVDLGNGEPAQIACGAPNVAAGQKVPVATVGTTLHLPDPDDPDARKPLTVEARELRGERSEGMICAEDELGLSDDHSGIMVLDEDAAVGTPFTDYLIGRSIEPEDTVFDIDLTPNRPDATSHIGVARDVAALTEGTLEYPEVSLPSEDGPVAEQIEVNIEAPDVCPRYAAMIVRNVSVGESPLWLKRRLTAIGLQPRNSIVDITNFVLHECGQPLHAFDLGDLHGDRIVVRQAEGEETITTLDDVERTVPDGALLICDDERPVAVAGVMGGANSEVTKETTDVLIESAYFDPSSVRRTAKALGVQTDSSYRFERGVDRDGQIWAAARAAELMAEIAGGTIVEGVVDAHPVSPETRTVTLRPDRLASVLGLDIPEDTAADLLETIGFSVTRGTDALHCVVPPFRPDVSIEEDLIEEVARLYGYDEIPQPERVPVPSTTPPSLPANRLRSDTRELLRGLGFREIYTNSMLREDRAEQFNRPPLVAANGEPAPVVETLNPISEEMAALRPSLLPGALEVMQHNRNHGQQALRFFEFGRIFHRATADESPVVPGFSEQEKLLIALSGPHAPTHWDEDPRDADFFDLKGTVETVLDALRLPAVDMVPGEASDASPLTAYHLNVTTGNALLGTVARVTDDVAASFDLDAPAFVAELDWSACVAHAETQTDRTYAPIHRFPVVERDLAVLVADNQPVGPMLSTIRAEGDDLLRDAAVFDIYEGEGVSSGKKSVAFALRFGADRTLTDEEVDAQIDAIMQALERNHGATLRQ